VNTLGTVARSIFESWGGTLVHYEQTVRKTLPGLRGQVFIGEHLWHGGQVDLLTGLSRAHVILDVRPGN
jgi:hypothetical protein